MNLSKNKNPTSLIYLNLLKIYKNLMLNSKKSANKRSLKTRKKTLKKKIKLKNQKPLNSKIYKKTKMSP